MGRITREDVENMREALTTEKLCTAYSFTSDSVGEGAGDTAGKGTGKQLQCTREAKHEGDHLDGAWAWRNEGGVPFRHDGRWLRTKQRAFVLEQKWI